MTKAIEQEVRRRAEDRCEYCRLPQAPTKLSFSIDHVRARQHGGEDDLENLALACGFCNRHKGPNIASVDSITGQIVPRFNPRTDRWAEHFRFEDAAILGLTPIGRATVAVLSLNSRFQLAIRRALISEGASALEAFKIDRPDRRSEVLDQIRLLALARGFPARGCARKAV
jgi:hypothetical protein